MHPQHVDLLQALKALVPPDRPVADNYHGQGAHAYLGLSVPQRRAVAKAWVTQHRRDGAEEVLGLVESLMAGSTYEEKTLGPLLLASHPAARQAVTPAQVSGWLGGLRGWAETDLLCQSLFPAEQLLADWTRWDHTLAAMTQAEQAERRRASLVLLTGPVRSDGDERLLSRSLANLQVLKADRDPLVSKAVSWLLRTLIARHRSALDAWMAANKGDLSAAIRREVETKLSTGLKSGRSQALEG